MQRQVIVTSFTNCSIANSIPLLHNNPKTNFHLKPKLTEILTFLKCMYTNGQTYHQPTTNQQTTGFKSYQNPPYHHTTKRIYTQELRIQPQHTMATDQYRTLHQFLQTRKNLHLGATPRKWTRRT